MKQIYNCTLILFLGASLLFVGCSDWTDVEPIEINEPGIESQNPALYTQYLKDLVRFKKSNHKISIGWFDNSNKVPVNQADHLTSLPDSLDYAVLMTPFSLTEMELSEMKEIRENKLTKILYSIDFDAIKLIYDNRKKDYDDAYEKALAESNEKKEEGQIPEEIEYSFQAFNDFLIDSVQIALSYASQYDYDGIVMSYKGKYKLHMSDADKIIYTGYENDFLGIAIDWKSRNANKELIFKGSPENIIDQRILNDSKFIIIPCLDVNSSDGLTYRIKQSAVDNAPVNKFIPMVQTKSLDKSDLKTGYWVDNILAVNGAAAWAAKEHDGFSVIGLSIYNINNDYYNPSFTYSNVRSAISRINPSVKQ